LPNASSMTAAARPGFRLTVAHRRVLVIAAGAFTATGLLWLAAVALSPGGFSLLDLLLLVLFALTLPWLVIGLCNATIGLLVMRFSHNPVAAIFPAAAGVRDDEPVTARTAILVCIRNEAPDRVIRNLAPLLSGLGEAGLAGRFHAFILSDTEDEALAAAEDRAFRAFAAHGQGRVGITYRRRDANDGFKAGNIREFCRRWGGDYDFALTLDADSFMSAGAVLRLVRIMQASPGLGILQSLVIGLPSTSAFARLFQFGMRLGMRSYTIGSAWWQADCGPYWGHNALLRLEPFIAHCDLPDLPNGPLGGPILSHDQIEAVLMRRAGYEVRVLPLEDQSWEENPATVLEFLRRDLRWCQGNMQYWHLLGLPGLKPISRYQLVFAILMFLGSPAWIGLLVLGTLAIAAASAPAEMIRPDAGRVLFWLVLVMLLSPKLATFLDVLTRAKERHAFGGLRRLLASMAAETVFSLMLAPIMWLGHTIFMARLPFTRTVGWSAQVRDDHAVPVRLACRALWPHTVVGWGAIGLLAATHPAAVPYALVLAGGLALSIPLAVITALPAVGTALARGGIGRLPEETATPVALRSLALPAITAARTGRPHLALGAGLRTVRGVVRSLFIYYGNRKRRAAMERLYARFVRPGDLVFDVGAHVGDRVAAFRRLGARVIAVEPQPALVRTLRLLYGRDENVVIEPVALGAASGTVELKLNVDNPTVSTASEEFIAAARGARGWEDQVWSQRVRVPMTTLDALIARHGTPAFVKIDVEGLEAQVLAGLTRPVPALSFEFTTIQRMVALAALDRCAALGFGRFDAALGESQTLVWGAWQSADATRRWLAALPEDANSGDIYAVAE
jgi:membrane glycosyltransferase